MLISKKLTFRAVAEMCGLIIGALSVIYISRIVGPEYLGFSATTSAALLLVSRLADGGLTSLAAQRLARDDEKLDTLLALTLPAKVLVSLVLVFVTLLVVSLLHIDPRLKYFMSVSASLVIFESCSPAWAFVALGKINIASIIRIGQSIIYAISILVVIHKPDDWKHLPQLTLFNSFINFMFATLFLFYFRLCSLDMSLFKNNYVRKLKDFYREAGHFLKADLSSYVYTTSDRVILYYFAGAHAVGIYEAAYKVINPFYSINSIITPTMFRDLAQSFKSGKLYPVMAKYVFTMSIFSIPLGFFLLFFSREVVSLLYGAKFIDSAASLTILGFVITFGFTSGIIVQPFTAWNMSKEFGSSIFWGNVLNTILNFILIPYWGAVGAALATLAAKIIVTVVGYGYFIRVTKYPIVRDFMCFFAAAALALLVVYAMSIVCSSRYVLAVSYGIVYLIIIYMFHKKYFASNHTGSMAEDT